MILSLILTLLVAIGLVLAQFFCNLEFIFVFQDLRYSLLGSVVILCAILLGVILTLFYKWGKMRSIAKQNRSNSKLLSSMKEQKSKDESHIEAMKSLVDEKTREHAAAIETKNKEIAALKDEMLRLLKKNKENDKILESELMANSSENSNLKEFSEKLDDEIISKEGFENQDED